MTNLSQIKPKGYEEDKWVWKGNEFGNILLVLPIKFCREI